LASAAEVVDLAAAEAIFLRALRRGPEGPLYPHERIHQSWNCPN